MFLDLSLPNLAHSDRTIGAPIAALPIRRSRLPAASHKVASTRPHTFHARFEPDPPRVAPEATEVSVEVVSWCLRSAHATARFERVSGLPILGSRSPVASLEVPTTGPRADLTTFGVPRPQGRPGIPSVPQQDKFTYMHDTVFKRNAHPTSKSSTCTAPVYTAQGQRRRRDGAGQASISATARPGAKCMTASCTVSAQRIAFERVFILTGSLSSNRHIRTRKERTCEPHDRVARIPKREVDRLDMVPCRLSRGHAHMARASGARVHVQKSDVCAAHLTSAAVEATRTNSTVRSTHGASRV